MPETAAASTSVSQKACHTPSAPSQLHSSAASGMMKITYRHSAMTSDSAPLPSHSSAPEAVVETAEITKPILMMRSAVCPAAMVSGFWVNSPISCPEAN